MFSFKSSYSVIEPIGEGLNASVYKVCKTHPNLKSKHIFALKVLKSTSDLKVFKLEFENLLKANGKHLVRYCGWETYKSRPALLLEYIDGVTLHELAQTFELSEQDVAWIHQETLKGLSELSESSLSHGDLSLKNIMIQKNGELKLIDFGLSHWSTKKIELTPEFAADELLKGASPSHTTDLISARKIIKKISTAFDPENIFTLSPKIDTPPKSLMLKVEKLKKTPEQTKSLSLGKKTNATVSKPHYLAWLFSSLLFLAPASASNNLKKEALYQIRSKSWIQVTNSKGQSCFTPCALNLKQNDLESLQWKDQQQSGQINIYTDSNKIISINL